VTRAFTADLVDARGASLGEGPVWLAQREELLWVDINGGHLHVADASGRHLRTTTVGGELGAALPGENGTLLLATDQGLSVMLADGEVRELDSTLADLPDLRFNDGKVDPGGHALLGTTSLSGELGTGFFGRVEDDGTVSRLVTGISVSNGLDWSLDGRTLYYIDTMTYRVDAFDHDPVTGTPTRRRTAFALPREWGYPDGMCIDADGFLWIAFAGGGCVRRFAPDGSVEAVVHLPVPGATSCTFGGPDLDTLFITTTRNDVSEEDLAGRYASSGGLFAVRTGQRGRLPTLWRSTALTTVLGRSD